jgi:hypothetical protein
MKPGYDSRPRVPAATPNSEAVRLRMLETTWAGMVSASIYSTLDVFWNCSLRTCVLCWTLVWTTGLIANSLSSFMALRCGYRPRKLYVVGGTGFLVFCRGRGCTDSTENERQTKSRNARKVT